jgi:hypothetical protein
MPIGVMVRNLAIVALPFGGVLVIFALPARKRGESRPIVDRDEHDREARERWDDDGGASHESSDTTVMDER